jgi:hypothetical protein
MADVKEIKSIELTPFTLMSSTIHAILAFIVAILMLIAFGTMAALIPQFQGIGAFLTWLGLALIIIYPISAFFINIAASFFSALLYNNLVPRVGGIKLGMEGNEVTQIPVIPLALILAIIGAIWAFIMGLFFAAAFTPFTALISGAIPNVSQAIANATNTTGATLPTGALVGMAGAIGAFLFIIVVPIMVLIIGFIVSALGAIFYNYIAIRVAKIQLEFAVISGTLHELKSIPVLPLALALGVIGAVFGLIQGILSLDLLTLISDIIGNFIQYFIIAALVAFFYNFLAPRIGTVKLDLE